MMERCAKFALDSVMGVASAALPTAIGPAEAVSGVKLSNSVLTAKACDEASATAMASDRDVGLNIESILHWISKGAYAQLGGRAGPLAWRECGGRVLRRLDARVTLKGR